MRWGTCIIATVVLAIVVLLASGCAADQKKQQANSKLEPTTLPVQRHYEPARAGSLVFDPPVTQGELPLQLSREDRTPDAFVSYDSVSTTYFYLRTDDRQFGDRHDDRYDRRAISTRVGVSYR